jgi:hypothetical protein
VCIELKQGMECAPDEFTRVREVLESSPGPGPVLVRWRPEGSNGNGSSGETPTLVSSLGVSPDAGLLSDLRALLGGDRVHLTRG